MAETPAVKKTFAEINAKIRTGKAVVVTAEEMTDVVRTDGVGTAARKVDVVTTGTFGLMCSSGAFLNFGHTKPKMRASRVWLNDVDAYAGIAAVDCYIGATQPQEEDPLNRVHPGRFEYGGGHVIEDLVAGKKVALRATSYGTDCYPSREYRADVRLADLRDAMLVNPRNAYQNYNCAVNLSGKTIYTYMGVLRPQMANATYSSAGQLSPLMNDPYYWTLGTGTKIFLGGAVGVISWAGTQHAPATQRNARGVPRGGAGTLMVTGLEPDDGGSIMTIPVDGEVQKFIVSEALMEDAGWRLHVLTPKAIATGRTLTTMVFVLLLILLALLAGGLVLQRRARLMRSIELQKLTQDELENRVALRTHDLNEANHNLKREVEERTQAEKRLRSTQQELIQAGKLAALGQMSAALSHELNQPLAAVKSYADNARTYLQRDKTDKASENIKRISEMADRMAELGNHLKNFARRPKQKVDGARLLDAIEVATRILGGRLRNAGVELVVEPFDPGLTVKAGLVRLQQVLINLISNALDAMEKHPGNAVHVDVEVLDDKVNINVRDYGPGIDDEIIRQVFDPFFTTKDVNKGLGLGLSISYNIVQDFGGSLTAANHPEGGAVFTVSLAILRSIKSAAE